MKTDTNKKILDYIAKNKEATAKELSDWLGISPRAVFKQLAKLLENRSLIKRGVPPTVFYSLNKSTTNIDSVPLPSKLAKVINDNYYLILPNGLTMEGVNGFAFWCQRNNLPFVKTAVEYQKTLNNYYAFRKKNLINGKKKFIATFPHTWIDEIYYLDFYSLERFGKTKLGSLLLYAKQSQNKTLMKKISALTRDKISRLLAAKKIDAIGFIPPTVNRRVQLMKELERLYNFSLPKIKLVKASSGILIPQKTLNKLADRIDNAANTIFVADNRQFRNILLIDDAVGSGATLNEVAKKIKEKNLVKGKIIGLALTGSFKGFDIISEI